MKFLGFISVFLLICTLGFSQDAMMDKSLKNRFDSLEKRIEYLEAEIPRLQRTRQLNLYFKKLELEKTRFIYEYEKLAFEEDLTQAEMILNKKTKAAIQRNDKLLLEFYEDYHKDLIDKMKMQAIRYQTLFAKEKNFKKELYKFLDSKDEYNIQRAQRMIKLAIKYANERNLKSTLRYLHYYEELVKAETFDFYSGYNLVELTNNEHQFNKKIYPLIESDSISDILEAQKIVDACYSYATMSRTKLNTRYFELQKNMVLKAISDLQRRQGDQEFLDEYTNQVVLAKLDSINKKGVYRWNDYILVIDEMIPKAQFESVRKGEAIIDADKKLIEYIRINRLAKLGNEVEVGTTVLLPYKSIDGPVNFQFNPEARKWQYMVCYTKVKNDIITRKLNTYLPPLQFEHEIDKK